MFELHGCENKDIHRERYDDDADVEGDEFVVFGRPLIHESLLYFADKVVVEGNVDDQILRRWSIR